MLFTSFVFFLFLAVFCSLYYLSLTFSKRAAQILLLIANYYFYLNVKPVFGLLLATITLLSYGAGLLLDSNKGERSRKVFLTFSIVFCLLPLLFFKYYNFLGEVLSDIASFAHLSFSFPVMELFLPIGISFFTFQTVGYLIDVYRNDYRAEKDILAYSAFVSFFPVILAGPIQRGNNLIPQLRDPKQFSLENLILGGKLFIWGCLMKLCVADRLATYVDAIYSNLPQHNGTSILMAAILYSFQIYCDFAGYSLMAIGTAKILGINVPENFRRPYFSASFKEFWSRWHIALSTWFRDYVYFPLGGNRVSRAREMFNLMVTFLASGLWHGANITFVIWGGQHGLYQIVEKLFIRWGWISKKPTGLVKYIRIFVIFLFTTLAWIYFRSATIGDAHYAIGKIVIDWGMPFIAPLALLLGMISLFVVLLRDFLQERKVILTKNPYIKAVVYGVLLCYIMLFGVLDSSQFIYFAF